MERKEVENMRRWNAIVNAILIAAALFTLARMAWGLDSQDITVEWTENGKKIATERQPKAGMVLVPAGEFVIGSGS